MGKGKTGKYGNFLTKIGYLDIRQKIDLPKKKKNYKGEWETFPGNIDVYVYHAKNQVAGPFKSHKEAKEKASELVGQKFKYKKPKS